MRNALCKIWNFILNRFSDVVEALAYGLKTIGEVVVPILGAIGKVIADTAGSLFSGPVLVLLLVGGYFFTSYLSNSREDKDKDKQRRLPDSKGPSSLDPFDQSSENGEWN